MALVRDVWRSKEPIPHLRVAALTTDSIEALRAYLQGEQILPAAELGLGTHRL